MVDRAFLLLFLSGMPKVPFGHLLLAQLITQLQILQPHYTPPGDTCQAFLKCFDVEDMHILPGKEKLHGKCSNDYTAIARGCEAFYAYGPRWDKQQESSKAAAGSSAHETPEGKRGKARSARAMLESLFSPGK